MKLKDPGDLYLNACFAELVAGWAIHPSLHIWHDNFDIERPAPQHFTTHPGAVMPYLNNENWASRYRTLTTHEVTITRGAKKFVGVDAEWAKAAVIALSRANGCEITFTK